MLTAFHSASLVIKKLPLSIILKSVLSGKSVALYSSIFLTTKLLIKVCVELTRQ